MKVYERVSVSLHHSERKGRNLAAMLRKTAKKNIKKKTKT